MNICWAVDKQLGDRIFLGGVYIHKIHKGIGRLGESTEICRNGFVGLFSALV